MEKKIVDAAWGVIPFNGKWGVFEFNKTDPMIVRATKVMAITWAVAKMPQDQTIFLRVYDEKKQICSESMKWPEGQRPNKEDFDLFVEFFNGIKFKALEF